MISLKKFFGWCRRLVKRRKTEPQKVTPESSYLSRFVLRQRRRALGACFCFMGLGLGMFAPKANASLDPIEKLFKNLLQYIATIIIKYYFQRWYTNTKSIMDDWLSWSKEQSQTEKQDKSEEIAHVGDAINTQQQAQYNQELTLATAPTPYCEDGKLVARRKKTADAVETANQSNEVKTENAYNPSKNDVTKDADTQYYVDDITGTDHMQKIMRPDLLFIGRGFQDDDESEIASDYIDALVGPLTKHDINTADSMSLPAQTYLGEATVEKVTVNLVKQSLMDLYNRRIRDGQADLGDFAELASDVDKAKGLSFMDQIVLTTKLFGPDSDFLETINGEDGYGDYTPMAKIMAKLKAEMTNLDAEINKSFAVSTRLDALLTLKFVSTIEG